MFALKYTLLQVANFYWNGTTLPGLLDLTSCSAISYSVMAAAAPSPLANDSQSVAWIEWYK